MDASALLHESPEFQDMDFEIEPGSQDVKESLDALKTEVDGPEIDEMSDEELRISIDDINEDLVDYLKVKSHSENKQEAARAKLQLKIYMDTLELFDDIKPLIEEEKFEKAEEKTIAFLNRLEKKLKKEDVSDEKIKEAIQQTQDLINLYGEMVDVTKKRPGVGMTILSAGIDIIPFVGGAKIATEGFIGRSMTGEKYGLIKRLLKVGEGTFWIAVDTAGVLVGLFSVGSGEVIVEGAAIAAKGAKGLEAAAAVSKTAKGLSTSAAALRAAKETSKGARVLTGLSRFVVEHPSLITKSESVIKAGKQVGKVTHVRDTFNVTKTIAKAPIDWTKRKLVLSRFREEREEFIAALGSTLDRSAEA